MRNLLSLLRGEKAWEITEYRYINDKMIGVISWRRKMTLLEAKAFERRAMEKGAYQTVLYNGTSMFTIDVFRDQDAFDIYGDLI